MSTRSAGAITVPNSLVDLLSLRCAERADEIAYRFISDDGSQTAWTCAELERAARRVAARLQDLNVEGEPVLLLYPPGLEYIAAFFGCLYSGAIAVPAYPPRSGRKFRRLETILADSGARFALTSTAVRSSLHLDDAPSLPQHVKWLSTDELPESLADNYRPRSASPESLAFLQYTSGSTGDPKGVMVSHGNLLHNLSVITNAFDAHENVVGVSWLPMYHDMGLIGAILGSMYSRGQGVLCSPVRFLQRPLTWLEAVTEHRASHIGAPNFAYDLCLERITPAERARLDLSSLRVAFCGAETIRPQTLERFAETFAPCGFRPEMFRPCYGLAESTLMVSARRASDPLLKFTVDRASLPGKQDKIAPAGGLTLVGCGPAAGDQQVQIVDPQTRRACPAGHIGEVWVRGGSVTLGYWNRAQQTAEVFGAVVADSGEGPFLRTGDLGFLHQDQLFITGRIKELMIVRGRKHYPQDIEFTAQSSDPALLPSAGAAFAIDRNGREKIVLIHELRREALRTVDAPAVISKLCQAVAQEYELALDYVGLVRPGSISRTTSGKIERFACRQRFLDDDFDFVELWQSPTAAAGTPANPADANVGAGVPREQAIPAPSLLDWISAWLARHLQLSVQAIDVQKPLSHYGLDSLMAVELLHDFELEFGREVQVGTLVDARSIEALAYALSQAIDDPGWSLWAPDTSDALLPGIARPTWRGPFGDRADGILVRGETPVREMMPYLMRGRNESVAYHEATYDITRTLQWLEQYNRQHPDRRATPFDLFLWAAAYVSHTRPGINRFVSGRRIYQRRDVAISFAAKKRFDAAAPLVTIKLKFPEKQEPFASCVERIAAGIDEACNGPPRAVDRETQFAMRLPRFILRAALWGYRVLDHCNLLPGKVIDNDPLYASLFVANLGSLGLDSTFHHLYEHGTCSLFAALGLPKKTVFPTADGRLETRQVWPVRWTLDERIADGFYSAGCMRLLKSILENPGEFVPADAGDQLGAERRL